MPMALYSVDIWQELSCNRESERLVGHLRGRGQEGTGGAWSLRAGKWLSRTWLLMWSRESEERTICPHERHSSRSPLRPWARHSSCIKMAKSETLKRKENMHSMYSSLVLNDMKCWIPIPNLTHVILFHDKNISKLSAFTCI